MSAEKDMRVEAVVSKILPYIKKGMGILDVGSGNCKIAKRLKDLGFNVMAVDVKNNSVEKEIIPILYDGKNLPFENDSFDISLLITVLHHTKDPIQILKEAKRVSKSIIVMEDLYDGIIQKYLTFAMDSILNKEYFRHPHTNKTLNEWEKIFKDLNLKIINKNIHDFWKFFTNGTFYLKNIS